MRGYLKVDIGGEWVCERIALGTPTVSAGYRPQHRDD